MYLSSFIQPKYISVLGTTTFHWCLWQEPAHLSQLPQPKDRQLNRTQKHLPNFLLYEQCRQILVKNVQDNLRILSSVKRGVLAERHMKVAGGKHPTGIPTGFHQDLSLWRRHKHTRAQEPTPTPHLLQAFSSISAMGTNAARDFPSNPYLKITLGCGRKASRLTLPHAALF